MCVRSFFNRTLRHAQTIRFLQNVQTRVKIAVVVIIYKSHHAQEQFIALQIVFQELRETEPAKIMMKPSFFLCLLSAVLMLQVQTGTAECELRMETKRYVLDNDNACGYDYTVPVCRGTNCQTGYLPSPYSFLASYYHATHGAIYSANYQEIAEKHCVPVVSSSTSHVHTQVNLPPACSRRTAMVRHPNVIGCRCK